MPLTLCPAGLGAQRCAHSHCDDESQIVGPVGAGNNDRASAPQRH
jgi:hypothetical protein